jgi:general secretion pathway protein K
MTCRDCSRLRRQGGAALIVAMLVFALATTLVVAMSKEFTLLLKRGANSFMAEQAHAYLRGGEELAGLILRQDIESDQSEETLRDDNSEIWAQQVPPYALDEGGWLVGRLEDLQGRFNLNSVAGTAGPAGPGGETGGAGKAGEPLAAGEAPRSAVEQRFTPAQRQFIRLLQTMEEPQVSEQDAILITEALMDWLDADGEPRDFGAEDDYYNDMSPSYRSANRPLVSVSELRLVAYMTAEIYRGLLPNLTVWGDGSSINIHTAPEAVLRTITAADDLLPLSKLEGETLVALRGEEGFENVQALLDSPTLAGRKIDAGLQARLGETSNWFLYSGEVEVADRLTRLYSVLHRDNNQIKALVRSSAGL